MVDFHLKIGRINNELKFKSSALLIKNERKQYTFSEKSWVHTSGRNLREKDCGEEAVNPILE